MSAEAVDPQRCPICGGSNQCAIARGESSCWCFSRPIPDEVLNKVPPEAHQLACVCQSCAFGMRRSSEAHLFMQELLRRRNGW